MKPFKFSLKKLLMGLAGLKMCTEKASGREALCSDRETSFGQLLQK